MQYKDGYPVVTVDDVMGWRPCERYTRPVVTRLFNGRDTLGVREIAALDIPLDDIKWAIFRTDFFTESDLRLLACDFAEDVLPIFEKQYPGDNRPRRAIEIARLFAMCAATREELSAAWDAAGAAARAAGAAAGDATWAAARAAGDAAGAATWAATWDAGDAAGDATWAAARAAGAAARAAGAAATRKYIQMTVNAHYCELESK